MIVLKSDMAWTILCVKKVEVPFNLFSTFVWIFEALFVVQAV